MRRGKPLRVDPEKQRAWQQRGAQKYEARQRKASPRPGRGKVRRLGGTRRNDAQWREDVLAAYGRSCVVCATTRWLQADHVWPRGQGGPSDVRNGLPLCEEHHRAKTEGRLRIRYEWLAEDQRAFLREAGWVWWDADGLPCGRGWKHFEERKGGTHGGREPG